jgi:hypothetical protein
MRLWPFRHTWDASVAAAEARQSPLSAFPTDPVLKGPPSQGAPSRSRERRRRLQRRGTRGPSRARLLHLLDCYTETALDPPCSHWDGLQNLPQLLTHPHSFPLVRARSHCQTRPSSPVHPAPYSAQAARLSGSPLLFRCASQVACAGWAANDCTPGASGHAIVGPLAPDLAEARPCSSFRDGFLPRSRHPKAQGWCCAAA